MPLLPLIKGNQIAQSVNRDAVVRDRRSIYLI